MDTALEMNQTPNIIENVKDRLPKLTSRKKAVMQELKSRIEQAKLNLIYTELDELNINHNKDYKSVKELESSLKQSLPTIDFNKAKNAIDKVSEKLDSVSQELEAGSTNAFTKLMTSDMSKSIAKTLGISLAGRTALILAPSITAKAAIGAGLAGYGLYRLVKNRKQIKETNYDNELNSILADLEVTKEGEKIVDTRFDEETQNMIKNQLKKMGVDYTDTGYLSLRQAIYGLETEKKKNLVDFININCGKSIDVEERLKKASKKLNVVATSATTAGVGAKLGIDIANTVNGIDPGLTAGLLNGTALGAWMQSVADKPWFSVLSGGLGFIGTELLERLPVIGGFAKTLFAAENIASFASLGATAGLATGAALGVASGIKQIFNYSKNKKQGEQLTKLDQEKYYEENKKELEKIKANLKLPGSDVELAVVDIVVGYLNDNGIKLSETPTSMKVLVDEIDKLNPQDKQVAKEILLKVDSCVKNKDFREQLIKGGKISLGLLTAGLAAMSIYDIVKGGTFLPELSQQLFPENNIHTPVVTPDGPDVALKRGEDGYVKAKKLDQEFHGGYKKIVEHEGDFKGDEYLVEHSGKSYHEQEVSEFINDNEFPKGEGIGGFFRWFGKQIGWAFRLNGAVDYRMGDTIVSDVADKMGVEIVRDLVPNRTAIINRLNELSPEELLLFKRYMAGNNATDDMTTTIKALLTNTSYTNKIVDYLASFETIQRNHEFANNLTNIVATGAIPAAVAMEAIAKAQQRSTTSKYMPNLDEIKVIADNALKENEISEMVDEESKEEVIHKVKDEVSDMIDDDFEDEDDDKDKEGVQLS